MPTRTDDTTADGRDTGHPGRSRRADDPSLELLGPGSFAPAAERSEETVARGPDRRPTVVAAGAVLALLVAFALLSRPGDPTPGDEPDAAGRAERAGPDGGSGPGTTERDAVAARLALRDIPAFDSGLPDDLPGVISGIDGNGLFVMIDRSADKPTESALGPLVSRPDQQPATWLGIPGTPLIGLDGEVTVNGTELSSDSSGVLRHVDLLAVVPDGSGSVLVVTAGGTADPDGGRSAVTARSVPLDGGGSVSWQVPSPAVEILGQWRESLLVRRGTHTWLLAVDGATSPVTTEQVLSFDGRNLALLACDGVEQCQLRVGTPDDPGRRSVPLPASLAELDPAAWTTSLAISPDGSRLAASVDYGVLSLPMVIDLDSGETRTLADGMNRQAPVVWSPDGAWLAYVYTDDVMVWPVSGERSWRITLDRPLDVLVWR